MANSFELQERLIRRTALTVLLSSSLMAALAAWIHSRQPAPHAIDLAMSGGLALAFLAVFVNLLLRPATLPWSMWLAYSVAVLGLAVPAWFYPWQAIRHPGLSLVDSYPPITSALLPLLLALIVFMRPRRRLLVALGSWAVVALPVLLYLLTHPAELSTPRGREMFVILGPVVVVFMVYIPFQRGIERWVGLLQSERARMQALAERDGLTGLYNRRAGEKLLANLVAEPEASDALILFDIDHFKRINDGHGHPVGDEVLRQVARRCESLLRQGDVFARWGGEEFLVLVRAAREDGGLNAAEHLRAAICVTDIDPVGIVTASFGVARFQRSDSLESWLMRADAALYAAKAGGRNRVVGD